MVLWAVRLVRFQPRSDFLGLKSHASPISSDPTAIKPPENQGRPAVIRADGVFGMDSGRRRPKPTKKAPTPLGLMRLVKKVLIRDKHTFEVWYRLPQFPGVRILTDLVPRAGQYAKRARVALGLDSGQAVFRLFTPSLPLRSHPEGLSSVDVRISGQAAGWV